MVTGSGGAIRNKEEEEKDTASGGAPTHRTRHRHGGPRLARRSGTMAVQFAWFPAIGLNVHGGRLGFFTAIQKYANKMKCMPGRGSDHSVWGVPAGSPVVMATMVHAWLSPDYAYPRRQAFDIFWLTG